MNKYWIRPILLCQGNRDKSSFTYLTNAGTLFRLSVFVWYVEGSEPKVLVDAGCNAELYKTEAGVAGLPMEDIQSVEEGLGKLGLKPEDIDIVIMTHLHGDHVQLASKYVNAKFIVQKAELDFALKSHPMMAPMGYFGDRFIKGLNIEAIEGDQEIIDGIRVMLTPGHSPGGQSVVIETPKGTAIIAGGCYLLDNFNTSQKDIARGLEVIPVGRHWDLMQAYDGTLRIKRTGYIIIPPHDPSFVGKDRLP